MSTLLKAIYRFKNLFSLYQNSNSIFQRNRKNNPKIHIHKRHQIAKAILRKEEQSWKHRAVSLLRIQSSRVIEKSHSDFSTYYKDAVIKAVWYIHKQTCRPVEQNREPRNIPKLIFNRSTKSTHWKRIVSSINGA